MHQSRLLLLFFALIPSVVGSSQSAHPLAPRFLQNESYIELYTITTQNDDGSFFQAQMTLTNLGLGSRNASVKMLFLQPGEKPAKVNMYYGPKDWTFQDTSAPNLTVGPLRIRDLDTETVFTGNLDSMETKTTFQNRISIVKPEDASSGYEVGTAPSKQSRGTFYEYRDIVPWSRAHSTLTLPGKSPRILQGYGMIEYSRSVGNPKDISRGWVTFRGYQGSAYFIANYRLPVDTAQMPVGWIWRPGLLRPATRTGLVFGASSLPGSGNDGPVSVAAADAGFKIDVGKQLCRYSFIDELGPLLGGVVSLVVGNPVTRYYTARVVFPGGGAPLQGYLELMRIE